MNNPLQKENVEYPFIIYKWMLFILFFVSMYPWFACNHNVLLIFNLLIGSYSLILPKICSHNFKTTLDSKNLFLIILCFSLEMFHGKNINGIISVCAQLIIWYSVLSLKNKEKEMILQFITKWLSIIIFISLIFFLTKIFGLPLLNKKIEMNSLGYSLDNYYFFLLNPYDGRFGTLCRFQSVFLEPGHMTLGIVPLLIINKFNIKNKYLLILLIAELLSFSLAGYITMLLGYIFLYFGKGIGKYILYLLSFLIIILGGLFYFKSQDIIETMIISRVISNGKFSINDNRNTNLLNKEFEKVTNSTDLIFGDADIGESKILEGSAGIKVFICQYGLLGVVLVSLFYLYYTLKYKTQYFLAVSMVYLLLLFQNAYATWFCVIGSYMLGMSSHIPIKINHYKPLNS